MLSKLVGNEHVKHTLRRLIASDRVPNSLLLAGDEGIGKRQFALEIARTFVCTDTKTSEPCGMCAACRRAGAFVLPTSDKGDDYEKVFFSEHPDVGIVIPFKRNVRVDAIRDLELEANFRPYEARARVFIVDDAEKMADAAANALLKTLEEPAPTTYIFLITSKPDSLLPTIRSRCQTIRFAPVETDEIERFLIEERSFTHDAARLASRLSRGSIGRAMAINVEDFRKRRERMLSVITSAIETGDRAAMLSVAEEMNDAKNKEAFEETLGILESLIHDVWSLRVSGDKSRVVNTDLTDQLAALAENTGPLGLPAWLTEIQTMRENLVVNINRKIATDALFVSMAGAR